MKSESFRGGASEDANLERTIAGLSPWIDPETSCSAGPLSSKKAAFSPPADGMVRPFIDGVIYELQRSGGISNYFNQILPRLCSDPQVEITLSATTRPAGTLPRHDRIWHRRRFPLGEVRGFGRIPARIRSFASRRNDVRWAGSIERTPGAVFHSTYYTSLPLKRVPSVVTVYDMIHERFSELFAGPQEDWFRTQKRRCVESASRVLAISCKTKTDLCELYRIPPERVDVTPLAVDAEFWLQHATDEASQILRRSSALRKPYLLYVGGRAHYKNFCGLVVALASWNAGRDFTLVIAGGALTNFEKVLIEKAGLRARVKVFVYPSDEELAALYAGAAAFVYPTRYEGFGLPILEAMAAGSPVVTTRGGSIPEVAGDAAEYFDADDPDSFVSALDRAVSPGRAAELRALGGRQIEKFSWNETAALTLASYRRALADR